MSAKVLFMLFFGIPSWCFLKPKIYITDISRWRACEASWNKLQPENLNLNHDISGVTTVHILDGSMTLKPHSTYYFVTNEGVHMIPRSAHNFQLTGETRFNFSLSGDHYCGTYKSTIWSSNLSFSQHALTSDNCKASTKAQVQPIESTSKDYKTLLDEYNRILTNSIGEDSNALKHGEGDPEYTLRAYERIKKWNPAACEGLSDHLDDVIKERSANLIKQSRRLKLKTNTTIPSKAQPGVE